MTGPEATEWVIELGDVGGAEARALLAAYYLDVSDRWFQLHEGRDTTSEELETGLPQMRSDDLAAPTGVFLVARPGDDPSTGRIGGCVGVRRLRDADGTRVAELRRMWVRPEHRGTGLAPSLLAVAEEVARSWGVATIRLDTRRDLVEALSLYRRNGWVDVPPFSSHPDAEVWLAKQL